ncbi:MAG TPA: hypothetical protein VGG69_09715 [Rhizomicrobium sp.]
MNAPFREPTLIADSGVLNLFAVFHLNLAFSSIEDEQRADVIRRCYWPLLNLAAVHGPVGIELTGFTLEEIARLDPEWIGRARALLASGRIELIGSGYAQIIGPLVPARVTEKNLQIGNDIYERWLGERPALALVNEQAYSAGLVGLYLDAGYRALLMDWDNCAALHPEWPAETRYRPQAALGADGRSIGLLWTNTVAFQKLQRVAHGDISTDDYVSYVRAQIGSRERTFCLYASDAEVFDFRPGRYRTEESLDGGEWARIADAFVVIAAGPNCRLVRPTDTFAGCADTKPLQLESAECPVPVKKQRKYNLSRWAVTGRDDIAINAACERIYRGLLRNNGDDAAWKELCCLWSSDFRTHITDKRWAAYCERLRAAENRWAARSLLSSPVYGGGVARSATEGGRYIEIQTPTVNAVLDRRRGLAIGWLQFAGHAKPVVGGLPHGHFDDIALQADWYTGDCVFEAPGEPKVTDLEWCTPTISNMENGDVVVTAKIETPNGSIEKILLLHAAEPRVDFDLVFHWANWGRGSLRLGHFTLLPDAFDPATLSLTTHNGGKDSETFSLNGRNVDHGTPVSFLVSCSYGFGMTEGWAEIGDADTRLRITVDRQMAPLLGLLTHKRVGGGLFCQLMLSALELDETRKPCAYRDGPRRFRFGIEAVPPVVQN